MPRRFDNKVAIVTGAAQGIGKAIAGKLAGEGARAAVADINPEGGEDAARSIGEGAFAVACDVSDEAQVTRLHVEGKPVLTRPNYALSR